MRPESFIEFVNDSKKVTEKRRGKVYDQIISESLAWSIAIVDEKEIDELNILNATKKALTIAVQELKVKPETILVDALRDIDTCRSSIYKYE